MDFYLDENDIFEEAEDIFSAVDDGLFEKDGMSISELNRLEF